MIQQDHEVRITSCCWITCCCCFSCCCEGFKYVDSFLPHSAVVQGSPSHHLLSCWIVVLLKLVWTRTSTKPTPGWLGRKMLQSVSLKTHRRQMSKASLEDLKASWGAQWLPRQGERMHLFESTHFINLMIFLSLLFFSPLISREGDCPVETKPISTGTVKYTIPKKLYFILFYSLST